MRDEADIISLSEDSAFSICLPLRQLRMIKRGKRDDAFKAECALETFHENLEEKRMNAYAEEKLSKIDTTAYRSLYVEEYETITTTGRPDENPIRPNGSGWRLVTSAAVISSIYCYVCWYWERRKNG